MWRKAHRPLRLQMLGSSPPMRRISAMTVTLKAIAAPSLAAENARAGTATIVTSRTAVAAGVIATAQFSGRGLDQDLDQEGVIVRAATTAAGNRKLSAPRRQSVLASIRIRLLPSSQRSKHRWTRGVRSQDRDDGTRRRSVRAAA